jgi:AcrR family transcriptional regulator
MYIAFEGRASLPMTAAKNRQRRRVAKLDHILDEAMALLAAEGIEALTLGRLAEALSLTPAALYRYVSSKDELIARLQTKSLAEISAIIGHSRAAWARSAIIQAAAPGVRPLIVLLAVSRLYVRLREDDSPHVQLITALVGDTRPVVARAWARRLAPLWMTAFGNVAEIIDEAVELGALSPGDGLERAALLWASLQGITQTTKLQRLVPSVFAVPVMAREATAGLALRWGATPGDVEAAIAAAERVRIRMI